MNGEKGKASDCAQGTNNSSEQEITASVALGYEAPDGSAIAVSFPISIKVFAIAYLLAQAENQQQDQSAVLPVAPVLT